MGLEGDVTHRQATIDFDRPLYPSGLPGHHGRDTEVEAAKAQLDSLCKSRREVYELVRSRGARGLTYFEAQEILRPSAQQRLSDLARMGVVIDSGERRPSPRGRACVVWVVQDYAERRS